MTMTEEISSESSDGCMSLVICSPCLAECACAARMWSCLRERRLVTGSGTRIWTPTSTSFLTNRFLEIRIHSGLVSTLRINYLNLHLIIRDLNQGFGVWGLGFGVWGL